METIRLNNILIISIIAILIITIMMISMQNNDKILVLNDVNLSAELNNKKIIYNNFDEIKKESIILKDVTEKNKQKIEKNSEIILEKRNKQIITYSDPYEIQTYDLVLEDKNSILSFSRDKLKRYEIFLKTDKSITSIFPPSNNILLKINLSDNGESIKENFKLMFNSNYKEFTEYFLFEIKSLKTNEIARCNGIFLNGITEDKIYTVQIDLSGNLLSCYIIKEEINKSYVKIDEYINKSLGDKLEELLKNEKLGIKPLPTE